MSEDVHGRAERLIAAAPVEGISDDERAWLEAHLEGCRRCTERATSVERAVAALRSVSISASPALVNLTRQRVRLRAQELRDQEMRTRALWISCALSWVFGALTAPLLWQGLEWVGQRVALPESLWWVALVFWWTVPAVAVAAALTWQHTRAFTEDSHSVTTTR